jgi:RNA polymerase sigma-70 factor (ECF subfamily)
VPTDPSTEPAAEAAGDPADLAAAAEVFAQVRPRLFGIAYRMLASSAEAEDIVQEAWLRWQAYDRSTVLDPPAFLATVVTRLAINAAQSARFRHETYIGPWLPEPVDTGLDPALGAERREALEFAVLLLLEKLSPPQRAAYVLREAFGYPYEQIAEIVQSSEATVRQHVSRARKHLATGRREPVAPLEQRRFLTAFLAAAQQGEFQALENLFAEDVISYTDSGGHVARAARIPVQGRSRVATFVTAFASHFWAGTTLRWVEANGQASVLVSRDDKVLVLVTIEASADGIEQILWVMNPDKLVPITPS